MQSVSLQTQTEAQPNPIEETLESDSITSHPVPRLSSSSISSLVSQPTLLYQEEVSKLQLQPQPVQYKEIEALEEDIHDLYTEEEL